MDDIVNRKIESFSSHKGDFYDMIETMSQKATLTNEELHEYNQWLKVSNDERLKLYQAELDGEAKGRAEGRTEGMAEGAKEQAWKTAERMHAKGMHFDDISEFTGLSISELQSRFN